MKTRFLILTAVLLGPPLLVLGVSCTKNYALSPAIIIATSTFTKTPTPLIKTATPTSTSTSTSTTLISTATSTSTTTRTNTATQTATCTMTATSPSCNGAVVTTLAGTANVSGSANGTGTAASFYYPWGDAVDSLGNVYVADTGNDVIRKITPGGIVTTFAGIVGTTGNVNGTPGEFNAPYGVAVDSSNNVYVMDLGNASIRKVTPGGVVSNYAGTGYAGSTNGPAATSTFYGPHGGVFDSSGNLYISDTWNCLIRKITPSGTVSTYAGNGANAFADGPALSASFSYPEGLAFDSQGNLFVGDSDNHRIRKITPSGTVSTFAGSTQGYADGTGTAAAFSWPYYLTIGAGDIVYVSDVGNERIRMITPAGVVSTLAGGTGGEMDGTGTAAEFENPNGIAIFNCILYVVDDYGHTIRKIQ